MKPLVEHCGRSSSVAVVVAALISMTGILPTSPARAQEGKKVVQVDCADPNSWNIVLGLYQEDLTVDLNCVCDETPGQSRERLRQAGDAFAAAAIAANQSKQEALAGLQQLEGISLSEDLSLSRDKKESELTLYCYTYDQVRAYYDALLTAAGVE
jgi:hypothetical protein